MAETLGFTLGEGTSDTPEVLPDARAQDEAYQALNRARIEQARLEARLEQRAGLVPGGGDLDVALTEPDLAPEGTSSRLAADRQSSVAARFRMSQAQQLAGAAEGVAVTAQRVRWLAVIGGAIIEALPIIIPTVVIAVALAGIGYCSQASTAGNCSALLGETLWESVQSAFGVSEDDSPPSTTESTTQTDDGSNPGTQDASDTGSATPPTVESTPKN